jgi:fucose permease
VLAVSCTGVVACYGASLWLGRGGALALLPASGIFMSVIYPTLNSKGISCVPKARHGAAAGVLLFFTCLSAVAAPLAMGLISDAFGDPTYGFFLAGALTGLLSAMALFNWIANPAARRLEARNESDYEGGIA